MITFAQQMLQALLTELVGVAATAGVIYVYWNYLTKKCPHHS